MQLATSVVPCWLDGLGDVGGGLDGLAGGFGGGLLASAARILRASAVDPLSAYPLSSRVGVGAFEWPLHG